MTAMHLTRAHRADLLKLSPPTGWEGYIEAADSGSKEQIARCDAVRIVAAAVQSMARAARIVQPGRRLFWRRTAPVEVSVVFSANANGVVVFQKDLAASIDALRRAASYLYGEQAITEQGDGCFTLKTTV